MQEQSNEGRQSWPIRESLTFGVMAMITIPVEGIEGAILRVGAVAVASTAAWKSWGKPTVDWFKKVREEDIKRHQEDLAWKKRIEQELSINGSKHLLPPDEQGLSLAEIVVRHHIKTAPLIEQFVKEHEKP